MREKNTGKRKPLVRVIRGFLAVAGILVAGLVLITGASILYLKLDERAEYRHQETRLAALRAGPGAPSASLGADRAIPDALPFDKLRLLATHNSYRGKGNPIGLFFIGLIQPGEPARLAYSHLPLSDQLAAGIRSFELDLRPRGEGFILCHVPLVDVRSAEPDFALALEELALWSDRNPGHLPLELLFELKEDYAFLDPKLGSFDKPALLRLDAALRKGLGSRLYEPSEMGGKKEGPSGAVRAKGWPAVGALRGRILVILHENEKLRALYEDGDPALESRAMFVCLPRGRSGAVFAILNDPVPDGKAIAEAVARGTIVRTRADADLDVNPAKLAAALASGAQIVSTDFPPGRPGPDGHTASLPGGGTVGLRP